MDSGAYRFTSCPLMEGFRFLDRDFPTNFLFSLEILQNFIYPTEYQLTIPKGSYKRSFISQKHCSRNKLCFAIFCRVPFVANSELRQCSTG